MTDDIATLGNQPGQGVKGEIPLVISHYKRGGMLLRLSWTST